jgi:type IV secretion system protein VirB9
MKLSRLFIIFTLMLSLQLAGCVTGSQGTMDNRPVVYRSATNQDQVVTKIEREYIPVPLPGQLQSLKNDGKNLGKIAQKKFKTKEAAVDYANKMALLQPTSRDFVRSIMTYNFMDGASYMVYTAPAKMTDLQFEIGENVISFAAGDTARWIIAKSYSGEGDHIHWHLLIKPNAPGLTNNLVVMTNRRVYHITLESTESTYMQSVKWVYPNDLIARFEQDKPAQASVGSGLTGYNINIQNMNTHYRIQSIEGNTKNWLPDMAFDDGAKTYIRFPDSVFHREMPVLMVDTGEKDFSSTVNYRVKGRYMIIDRLFDRARLVLGSKEHKNLAVVEITKINEK